jgi:hypothetical protein
MLSFFTSDMRSGICAPAMPETDGNLEKCMSVKMAPLFSMTYLDATHVPLDLFVGQCEHVAFEKKSKYNLWPYCELLNRTMNGANPLVSS